MSYLSVGIIFLLATELKGINIIKLMATDKITLEELQKMISYLEATVDNSGEKLMPTPAVKNEKTNCEKVESFRKQGEYGPKKFIKP